MGVKLSRDQKRKAKRAEKENRTRDAEIVPYEGEKYRHPRWAYRVYATELAVYETIKLSRHRLTNEQTRRVFIQLIKHLRASSPAPFPSEPPEIAYERGKESEYLNWAIRRNWTTAQKNRGPIDPSHYVGILRTLLYSIDAHEWNTGKARGYVAFLEGFVERTAGALPIDEWQNEGCEDFVEVIEGDEPVPVSFLPPDLDALEPNQAVELEAVRMRDIMLLPFQSSGDSRQHEP